MLSPIEYSDRMDRQGDFLPKGASARLGSLRYRAPYPIERLFVLPGQKQLLVYYGIHESLMLCDLKTGKFETWMEKIGTPNSADHFNSILFSAKMHCVIVSTKEGIIAYEFPSKKILWKTTVQGAMFLSPDEELISVMALSSMSSTHNFIRAVDGKHHSSWDLLRADDVGSFTTDSKYYFRFSKQTEQAHYFDLDEKAETTDPKLAHLRSDIVRYSWDGKYFMTKDKERRRTIHNTEDSNIQIDKNKVDIHD